MDWDWDAALSDIWHLGLAYVLSLPVGWNRERADHSAGLRTFPLVAIASAGYALVATRMWGDSPDAQARILQGLITGIGFVGGGAILKRGSEVQGTATATAIWSTGAIGATVAFDRLELAVLLSALNFLTLTFLTYAKRQRDEIEAKEAREGEAQEGRDQDEDEDEEEEEEKGSRERGASR